MFTRILVPTDFSRPADAALAHARRVAECTGAHLHLLRVVGRTMLADQRAHVAAALRQLLERLPRADPGAILSIEHSESPADEITRYARTHDIDLIVMGRHDGGRMAGRASVTARVAGTAPCPVLTLRQAPFPPDLEGLQILVATDFSESSDAALGYARRLAAMVRGSVRLLHVMEQPASTDSSDAKLRLTGQPRGEPAAPPQMHLSQRMLVDSRSRMKIDSDVVFGPKGPMISEYAGNHGFDLIVLGTHGRTCDSHPLMGRVAEAVIRTAPCPVLTVRSREPGRSQTNEVGAIGAAV